MGRYFLDSPDKIYGFDSTGAFVELSDTSLAMENGKLRLFSCGNESGNSRSVDASKWLDASPAEIINCRGKTVSPSFVDPHTHLVYAGDRAHEFFMRNRGVPYLEIAAKGGGIGFSVRQSRAASDEELLRLLLERLQRLASFGVTHVEVKSGYGLSVADELRMLRVINKAKSHTNMVIVSTLLAAHDFPPEAKGDRAKELAWCDTILNDILPAVRQEKLASFFDIFSEEKVFNLPMTEKLLSAAKAAGFSLKLHADELSNIGAGMLGIEMGAISMDHLLRISPEEIAALKTAQTVPVLLPGTAFYLGEPFAPFADFEKDGVDVALASDSNPGSNCTENILLTYSIAAMKLKMTESQILKASTLTASKAIALEQPTGIMENGAPANIAIIDAPSLQYLYYHYGHNPIVRTFVEGEPLWFKS